MGEEIAFENDRISDFNGLVTLTLDRVILHHSSTSTYIRNFVEIKETFCGQTDIRTDERTFETGFIRLRGVHLEGRAERNNRVRIKMTVECVVAVT